jgi:nitroreductase
MEQMLDIIKKRMSIRAYQDKPIPEEVLISLLEAARQAPTARNLQQLEYRVVINKNLSQKMSDRIGSMLAKEMAAHPPKPGTPAPPPVPARPHFFYNAPVVILITGPKDNAWIETDAALAVENIMLFATSADLGTCFIGMARFLENDNEIMHELHISPGHRIAACVICGYPNEKPAPKEKRISIEYFR